MLGAGCSLPGVAPTKLLLEFDGPTARKTIPNCQNYRVCFSNQRMQKILVVEFNTFMLSRALRILRICESYFKRVTFSINALTRLCLRPTSRV